MHRSPSPLVVVPLVGAGLIYSQFSQFKHDLAIVTGDSRHQYTGWAVASAVVALVLCALWLELGKYVLFIWHCFIVPLGSKGDQKHRLDKFYRGQARVYDKTRASLLRGRNSMLSMSAEHILVIRESNPNQRLVWVDVGGGTGWNVEAMDAYFPISAFDAVYVVDLCQPLLDLAEERFAARGWKNVTCLCQDATSFTLPEWSDGVNPKGSLGFISLSYSLSMVLRCLREPHVALFPFGFLTSSSYHTLLDRLDYLLAPNTGLLSVVDFYTCGKQPSPHEKAIGGASKKCGWLSRWFWQIWFDFDHVDLSPGRRDYLEYRFGTVKSFNGRNNFIFPFIVRIPYYIWIGCSRARDTSRFARAFEIDGGNLIGNCSPVHGPTFFHTVDVPSLHLGETVLAVPSSTNVEKTTNTSTAVNITPPLSSFHYQLKHPWRLPYFEQAVHAEFRTWIYSFTWEDPEVDMCHMNISKDDSIFAITSAGDNVLHYAIHAQPRCIHAVDMNPCQGHILELKLAAIKALDHQAFFAMFGTGRLVNFRSILNSKLSPYLSSPAYQFWRINTSAFDSSFYLRGYAGWALRAARWIAYISGKSVDMKRICEADTIEEQATIWKRSLRSIFVQGSLVQKLVDSPVFLWNALGVPKNQKSAFTKECTVYEFIRDTLDPIGSHALLSKGAYHYLLCLLGHYTPESCPEYLTPTGFEALKANDGALLDAFRLHTDSIVNVLRGLPRSAITRAIIMDHLDWFAPGAGEIDEEVAELHRALAPNGTVFWRSAAKYPWYSEIFERAGFKVEVLGMREGPHKAIDRVNMYASFYKATKI